MLTPSEPALGHFHGTGIRGGIEHFVRFYGPAAAQTAVTKLSSASRALVDPHDPALGILGARKYAYAFVGELMRAMASAVKKEEDLFLRDIVNHGVDATLNTVARSVLRYIVSPQMIASRAQEMWNVFHDCGRIQILSINEHEYLAQMNDWPNHDTTVCKMCGEARRRVVERTGMIVEVRRERCQAWGHEACTYRVKWRKP
jgi:hypothetical protein